MAVLPISPSIIVSLIGGAGAPDPKEETVHNPTFAHFVIEAFFIAVLLLCLWGIGRTIEEADGGEGY